MIVQKAEPGATLSWEAELAIQVLGTELKHMDTIVKRDLPNYLFGSKFPMAT